MKDFTVYSCPNGNKYYIVAENLDKTLFICLRWRKDQEWFEKTSFVSDSFIRICEKTSITATKIFNEKHVKRLKMLNKKYKEIYGKYFKIFNDETKFRRSTYFRKNKFIYLI